MSISILKILGIVKQASQAYDLIMDKLSPDYRSTLEKALQKHYDAVVEEFEQIYPYELGEYEKLSKKDTGVKKDLVRTSARQMPFYHWQEFIDVFLAYYLFLGRKNDILKDIIPKLKENQSVIYTEQAIDDFIKTFATKLYYNAELRILLQPYQLDKHEVKLNEIIESLNKITKKQEELDILAYKFNRQIILGQGNISLQDIHNSNITINQNFINSPGITDFILDQLKKQFAVKLYRVPARNLNFTGREQDLEEIHRLLQQGNSLLLFKGYGGIGKTTLAIEYCHRHKADYDHILWTVYDGSLDSTISQLAPDLGITKSEGDQNISDLVKAKINSLPGNVLLVIDNFYLREGETGYELRDFLPNVKKLITSRHRIPYDWLKIKNIDKLPPDEARTMFLKYCQCQPDEAKLQQLMETVDYHTLTLELSAKLIKKYTSIDLGMLIQAFRDKNTLAALAAKVRTNYSEQELRISNYLDVLFDLSKLTEQEINLLRQFAVLPAEFIPYQDLVSLLQPEDEIEFEDLLDSLSSGSWLQKQGTDYGKAYRCPPVIQDYIRQKYPPEYEFYEGLVENLAYLLYPESSNDPIKKIHWLPYGLSILYNLEEEKLRISTVANNISLIYYAIGNLDKALEYGLKSIKIKEQVLDKNDPYLAISYNNIAYIYNKLGEKENAYNYITEAVEIFEKQLPANHPHLLDAIEFKFKLASELGKPTPLNLTYDDVMRAIKSQLDDLFGIFDDDDE